MSTPRELLELLRTLPSETTLLGRELLARDGERELQLLSTNHARLRVLLSLKFPEARLGDAVELAKQRGIRLAWIIDNWISVAVEDDSLWVWTYDGLEARATRGEHLEIDSGARVPVAEIARFTADVNADDGYAWLDVVDHSGATYRVISRNLPSHRDPTHTWNEILYESAWAGILSRVLGEWFGVPFDV
ncbi:MAG: hypothetical protein IPM35_06615 [Myxococcales bacterium]|nr:hypothetical protein [Myxococcales bacterium]